MISVMEGQTAAVKDIPALPMLFLLGLTYGLAAIILSTALASSYVGTLAVALTALGLVDVVRPLFLRHREISWAEKTSRAVERATGELVLRLLAVLVGVVVAYVVLTLSLSDQAVRRLFDFQIKGVFAHTFFKGGSFAAAFGANFLGGIVVSGIAFFLAAIYKEAGISLLTAWIGSLWGIGLSVSFQTAAPTEMTSVFLTVLALAAGSLTFFSMGAAGLFLARGAYRYPVKSSEYRGILRMSLSLFGAAMSFMLLSALLSALA